MSYYSKLIAAVIGIAVLISARYGLDLVEMEAMLVEVAVGLVTAFGVWKLKNNPTTEAQVEQARDQITEANKEIA